MKMSNLRKNKFDQDERNNDDDDNDENSDEELDEQPELEAAMVKHIGGINRLRVLHECFQLYENVMRYRQSQPKAFKLRQHGRTPEKCMFGI